MGKTVVYFVKSAEYGTYFLVVSRCVDAAVNIANEGGNPLHRVLTTGDRLFPPPAMQGRRAGQTAFVFMRSFFARRDALYLMKKGASILLWQKNLRSFPLAV